MRVEVRNIQSGVAATANHINQSGAKVAVVQRILQWGVITLSTAQEAVAHVLWFKVSKAVSRSL